MSQLKTIPFSSQKFYFVGVGANENMCHRPELYRNPDDPPAKPPSLYFTTRRRVARRG